MGILAPAASRNPAVPLFGPPPNAAYQQHRHDNAKDDNGCSNNHAFGQIYSGSHSRSPLLIVLVPCPLTRLNKTFHRWGLARGSLKQDLLPAQQDVRAALDDTPEVHPIEISSAEHLVGLHRSHGARVRTMQADHALSSAPERCLAWVVHVSDAFISCEGKAEASEQT